MRDRTSDIVSAGSLIAVLMLAGILGNIINIKRAVDCGGCTVSVGPK